MADILTQDEVNTIVLSLAKGSGERGFTEDDGVAVLDWARSARIDAALLNCVLNGTVLVTVGTDGEVRFQAARGDR